MTLTYDPVLNGNGIPYTTFTFRVRDSGGLISVATYTYQFNITPVNDAPTAVNDVRSTPEDTPVNWDLTSNDADIDGTGEILTHNTWTQPSNGIITQSGVSLRYTPTLNYCGTDNFSYSTKDQNNAISNTGTVSITVTCVNDVPIAVNDSGSIAQSSI
jgi:large repetitive protein